MSIQPRSAIRFPHSTGKSLALLTLVDSMMALPAKGAYSFYNMEVVYVVAGLGAMGWVDAGQLANDR